VQLTRAAQWQALTMTALLHAITWPSGETIEQPAGITETEIRHQIETQTEPENAFGSLVNWY